MRLVFAIAIYLSLRVMLPEIVPPEVFESPVLKNEFVRDTLKIRPSDHKLETFKKIKGPTGIAHLKFVDLTFLTKHSVGIALHWIALGALVAYVAGLVLPVSTLIIFLIHCAIFTLNNSTGSTHHGYQILTITLLAQTCALWFPILFGRLPEKARRYLPRHDPDLHRRDLFVYYSQVAIAGCYVIAGLSKVLRSHVKWIIDSPDVSVQIVKSHSQKYYEYLQPEWADKGMTYATWIAENPWLTRIMLTSGLLLELFAFLLLINRAWAAGIGISLILMHLAIGELMGLHFPQNIQADFGLLVNAPFWLFAVFAFVGFRKKTALR